MFTISRHRMNETEKKMINAVESWTDMRTNTSVFEQVEMEQGDLLKRVISEERLRLWATYQG